MPIESINAFVAADDSDALTEYREDSNAHPPVVRSARR
jgi:hypothetical protein